MNFVNKKWSIIYLIVMFSFLFVAAMTTIVIDPYFHYHKPLESFFYTLDNQRSQNDGIIKNFDYDAIITGTSMTENFKVSEMNALFEVDAIKVPFSGGTYKEIDDNLRVALANNSNIGIVVRGLDMSMFFDDKDRMRFDLGTYPTYLYDENMLNDGEYLLNKEILLSVSWPMIRDFCVGTKGGMTDFDTYSNWMADSTFGAETVLTGYEGFGEPEEKQLLTEEEKEKIEANIRQNVISVAEQNPNVKFYCFFSPYSIAWWGSHYQGGTLDRQIDAEGYIIELLLECDNILLFSYNDDFEMITDLDNYKDLVHYGEWINSYILESMRTGEHQLTKDNYKAYIEKEREFYTSFNYNSLFN